MEIILIENVEKLGNIGNLVNVKNGYGRNFLIPQGKALLATQQNKAFYEAQKATIAKGNQERLSAAEKDAEKLEGEFFVLIRQASDDGRLYGSVSSRDVAKTVTDKSGLSINKSSVFLDKPIKDIGVHKTVLRLHAGVNPEIFTVVARSEDEAKESEAAFKSGKNKASESADAEVEAALLAAQALAESDEAAIESADEAPSEEASSTDSSDETAA